MQSVSVNKIRGIWRGNLRNWLTLRILALTVAATSFLVFFIKVAEEVVEGDAHAIDRWILM
ncbi:MAG: phosphatase PAP2 family protein, partial [Methylosarcina sp.]